jgi:hypothetical protein
MVTLYDAALARTRGHDIRMDVSHVMDSRAPPKRGE